MDYTVPGILQARILEWVASPFSRVSSQPRDQTQVSHIAGGFFTSWATRKAFSGRHFLIGLLWCGKCHTEGRNSLYNFPFNIVLKFITAGEDVDFDSVSVAGKTWRKLEIKRYAVWNLGQWPFSGVSWPNSYKYEVNSNWIEQMIFNKSGMLEHPQITFIILFGSVNVYCIGTVVERHIGGGTLESSDEARMWPQGISPTSEEKPLCPWGGVAKS